MPQPVSKRKMNGKSLSRLFGGEFPVFVLFLVMAFFFWWSRSMNSNFETVVNVPVRLENIPEDMRITYDLPPSVSVSIAGKGTSLMKASRMCRKNAVGIDCHRFAIGQQRAAFAVWELRDSLADFLPQSVMIRGITPDTLAFGFARQSRRLLPVEAVGDFESVDQFFVDRVQFSPDSVWAFVLDGDMTVHSIRANVDGIVVGADSVSTAVRLEPAGSSLPVVSQVQLTVLAEQYTEKRVEVPVQAVDFPHGVRLKTFPSRVTVSSWVRMSDYDRVAASDFKVGVDYRTLNDADGGKAGTVLLEKPAGVKNVRILSGLIEYLLEKD